MLRVVLAVVTTAILATVPAAAAETAKKDPGSRMVCRTLDESGSRTRSNRVCKTKAEWDQAENAAKHEAWKMERSGAMPSELRQPR